MESSTLPTPCSSTTISTFSRQLRRLSSNLASREERAFGKPKANQSSIDRLDIEAIRLVTQFPNGIPKNSSNISQTSNSGNFPSQPLSNPWGSFGTLFRRTNQEEMEDALLNEEDVESLHECLEEVEKKNEVEVAEDVDQMVEDNDKEPKGMEIVHSDSSEATPSKLPSELQFEWANLPNLNFIGPQHYALLEMDDQLGALDGVLDEKEEDSTKLDSEFKSYSEHLHKLHNNRAKVGAFSLKKHVGHWQLQEKLVDSQTNGWTNHVWDPEKSFKNHHFWRVITCVRVFWDLLNMDWDPLEPTQFKHWWRFKDGFKHKPPKQELPNTVQLEGQ
ncbi:hypothetical protein PIB30_014266 [Stylosanthes scabra]|uniref:Uncharacterized protein n=1 Tax=Stylosanthes scabra TaxID=79078 RepID=A0ABU6Y8L9_9FABA|nr:hypothetical protein [Stylosanthes scabra]